MKNSLATIFVLVMIVLGVCLASESNGNLRTNDTFEDERNMRVLMPAKVRR